jgi:hypothetical protein
MADAVNGAHDATTTRSTNGQNDDDSVLGKRKLEDTNSNEGSVGQYDWNIDVKDYQMPALKPLDSAPVYTPESPALGELSLRKPHNRSLG